jgi:hypothetical protein
LLYHLMKFMPPPRCPLKLRVELRLRQLSYTRNFHLFR